MIKDAEVAMVNAASKTLEIMDINPNAETEVIIRHVLENLDAPSHMKVMGVAAANEVIKLRRAYQDRSDKQILQMFVDNIYEFLSKMNEGSELD